MPLNTACFGLAVVGICRTLPSFIEYKTGYHKNKKQQPPNTKKKHFKKITQSMQNEKTESTKQNENKRHLTRR